MLGSCAAVTDGGAALAEASSVPAASATATVFNWFPPTSTPTIEVVPSPQPTPERKPGIGAEILRDAFSSEADWNIATSDQASVRLTGAGLTIAAQPGLAPVVTFRAGSVFGDMYLEVTANTSLCRDGDQYGLAFRAPNNIAYYRYSLACDGTASAGRVSLGNIRVLQPPTASADVPEGAPGTVRLGLWIAGAEFRFFLNDRYQFSASDPSYHSGGIGFFAQAQGDTPVIVTFTDLTVRSVKAAVAAATATP